MVLDKFGEDEVKVINLLRQAGSMVGAIFSRLRLDREMVKVVCSGESSAPG